MSAIYSPDWWQWRTPSTPADYRVPPRSAPANTAASPTAEDLVHQWIISPAATHTLITNGAMVLDARNLTLWHLGRRQGSVAVSWRQFSQPDAPQIGELLTDPGYKCGGRSQHP